MSPLPSRSSDTSPSTSLHVPAYLTARDTSPIHYTPYYLTMWLHAYPSNHIAITLLLADRNRPLCRFSVVNLHSMNLSIFVRWWTRVFIVVAWLFCLVRCLYSILVHKEDSLHKYLDVSSLASCENPFSLPRTLCTSTVAYGLIRYTVIF